jgi:high-affinity nickel permease
MGLVLVLTGGAVIVLKAYNTAAATDLLARAVPALRQQAAVVATLAGMVFLLLDALEKGKVAMSLLSSVAPVPPVAPGAFGRTGLTALAANVPG